MGGKVEPAFITSLLIDLRIIGLTTAAVQLGQNHRIIHDAHVSRTSALNEQWHAN